MMASDLRPVVALGLGMVGLGMAVLARQEPGTRWLSAVAWGFALLVFGWPWLRRCSVLVPARAAGAFVLAGALSALAARTWVAAPFALAAWTGVGRMLGVHWTTVLTAAVVALAGSAGALALGARVTSDSLAVLAYGLACLACCTAAVDRLRSSARRIR